MIHPTMEFSRAADAWLQDRMLHIRKPRTLEAYQLYIRNLTAHLKDRRLSEITSADVLEYQHTRRAAGASPSYINHETNTLSQILKAADLWDIIAKKYKPLPQAPQTAPKVMTPEEEARFWRVANSKTEWRVAVCANVIAANTTAICSELRHVRLRDLFLEHEPPMMHIDDEHAKNAFRGRRIPLNPAALAAVTELLDRARNLGACRPEHYLFPIRVARNRFDVTRPATRSFLKRAFGEMRDAAGLPWLQHRHFRNMAITRLFESGASDETITAIAGHRSIKMSRYYARIRIEARADALNAIGSTALPASADAAPTATPSRTSLMSEAAKLVKETGVDVQTAIQIVRGFMEETASKVEGSLDAVRRKISRAEKPKPDPSKVVSLDGKKVLA